jgi:hypothetical protein
MSHPGAGPSWPQFSWEASMCDQKYMLMDGLRRWELGGWGSASMGSGLLCFLSHHRPLPHLLCHLPSPPKLHLSLLAGLLGQSLQYWLILCRWEAGCSTLCSECTWCPCCLWDTEFFGEGHFLDSDTKRWVAFPVFSLGLGDRTFSHPYVHSLQGFPGFLSGSALSTIEPHSHLPNISNTHKQFPFFLFFIIVVLVGCTL